MLKENKLLLLLLLLLSYTTGCLRVITWNVDSTLLSIRYNTECFLISLLHHGMSHYNTE